MDQEILFATHRWDLPKILLVSAAAFALAANGFFLAVFLQLQSDGGTSADASQGSEASLQERKRVLNQLAGGVSEDGGTGTPATADSYDASDAAKLKILQSLNSN